MDYEPISTDAPAGTAIFYRDDFGSMVETFTRSVPWLLASGQWVVKIDGGVGGRMSNPIIKIAAQLARGDFLPRSGRLSARELERLEQQHRDAAVEMRKAHDALACPPRPSPYPEAAEALREAAAIVRANAPREDLGIEPAYTSDPPQPSPDGVTWYGLRRSMAHDPYSGRLAVSGDNWQYLDPGEDDVRDALENMGMVETLAEWPGDCFRTVDPVSRPSWAEETDDEQ